MTLIDTAQLVVIVVAAVMQLTTICLAAPMRSIMPKGLWMMFLGLNLAILGRRFLTLADVHFRWNGEAYDSLEALIGLAVSVLMMLSVLRLRNHMAHQKRAAQNLAKATVELAHKIKAEDSLAYQLAMVFIEQREQRENDNNGVLERMT